MGHRYVSCPASLACSLVSPMVVRRTAGHLFYGTVVSVGKGRSVRETASELPSQLHQQLLLQQLRSQTAHKGCWMSR